MNNRGQTTVFRDRILDAVQFSILLVGLVASGATYTLMRHPGSRRPQFRSVGGFSFRASLLAAIAILATFVAIACVPGQ